MCNAVRRQAIASSKSSKATGVARNLARSSMSRSCEMAIPTVLRTPIRSRRPAAVFLLCIIGPPFNCANVTSGCASRTYCCRSRSMSASTSRIFGMMQKACFEIPVFRVSLLRRRASWKVPASNARRAGGEKTLFRRGHPSNCRAEASQARDSLTGSPMGMSIAITRSGSALPKNKPRSSVIRNAKLSNLSSASATIHPPWHPSIP